MLLIKCLSKSIILRSLSCSETFLVTRLVFLYYRDALDMSLIEEKKFTGKTFLILIFRVHFHYASTILVMKLGLTEFIMMVMMMIMIIMRLNCFMKWLTDKSVQARTVTTGFQMLQASF